MDKLMNAGKAAGFADAKGKKIKVGGFKSSGFKTLGDDINDELNVIGDNHDVLWIDTMAVPMGSHKYITGAIIYYVER